MPVPNQKKQIPLSVAMLRSNENTAPFLKGDNAFFPLPLPLTDLTPVKGLTGEGKGEGDYRKEVWIILKDF
jgi:hypothetical protein